MKNLNILKTFLLLAFVLPVLSASAQKMTARQVLVASGGDFSNLKSKIKISAYDPATKKDTIFDSVPGRNVNQILVDTGDVAYVATDSTLVKYDLKTLKRLKTSIINSLRHMAIYKDFICITIGEEGNFVHFQILRRSDLSLVYQEKNIPDWGEGLTIAADSAYIAVQDAFPYKIGRIAVIDLANHKLVRVLNLGANAKGIAQMYNNGSYVVGVSERFSPDTAATRITRINLKTGAVNIVPITVLNAPFDLYGDSLYCSLKGGIGAYNTKTNTSVLHVKPAPAYAAAVFDTADKLFFTTGYDYVKPTKTYIYSFNGKKLDSFKVGVAPEGIAINYGKKKSGINESVSFGNEVQLFPNPAKTMVYMMGMQAKSASIHITDMAGKLVYSESRDFTNGQVYSIPVEGLSNGVYIINFKSAEGSFSRKFIKN
jgi:hypothetical protein